MTGKGLTGDDEPDTIRRSISQTAIEWQQTGQRREAERQRRGDPDSGRRRRRIHGGGHGRRHAGIMQSHDRRAHEDGAYR